MARHSSIRRALALLLLGAGCARPAPAPPPVPAPRVVPVATARARVVVGHLRECTPAQPLCFDEEMAGVGAAITERLADQGYDVVPDAELRKLYADVRSGHLPGLREVCPNAPPGHRVAELLYAGALEASPNLECGEDSCELSVAVDVNPDDPTRYVIQLPAQESPAQWAARIRQQGFTRAPEGDDGAMGGLGIMGGDKLARPPGVYASIWSVAQSGAWSYELDGARFQPLAAAFDACEREHAAPRMAWGRFPFTISVDAQGRVSRCESTYLDLKPFFDADCKCELLRRIDFGAGSAERRARFHVRIEHELAVKPTMWREARQAERGNSDDPYVLLGLGGVSDETLGACLDSLTKPVKQTVAVRFQVRADGSTEQATASWPSELPSTVHACLDAALLKAQFTCPKNGRAQVEATLSLSVQPRGR